MSVPPVRPLTVRGAVRGPLTPRAPEHASRDRVFPLHARRIRTPPRALPRGLDVRVSRHARVVHRALFRPRLRLLPRRARLRLRRRLARAAQHTLRHRALSRRRTTRLRPDLDGAFANRDDSGEGVERRRRRAPVIVSRRVSRARRRLDASALHHLRDAFVARRVRRAEREELDEPRLGSRHGGSLRGRGERRHRGAQFQSRERVSSRVPQDHRAVGAPREYPRGIPRDAHEGTHGTPVVSFPRGVSLGDVPRDDGAGARPHGEKFSVEGDARRVALAGERGDVANHPALARAHVQERGDGLDRRASLRFLSRDGRVDARDDGAAVRGESKGRTARDAVDVERAAKFSGVELPRDEGAFRGAVRGEKLGVAADVELSDWSGVHLERLEQANVSARALVFGEAPRVREALVGAHRDGGPVERERAHGGGGETLASLGTTRHLLGNLADANHLFLGPIANVEDVEARGVVAVGGDDDVLEDGDVLERAAGGVGDDARALDERDGVEVAVRSGVVTLSRGGAAGRGRGEVRVGEGARSPRVHAIPGVRRSARADRDREEVGSRTRIP